MNYYSDPHLWRYCVSDVTLTGRFSTSVPSAQNFLSAERVAVTSIVRDSPRVRERLLWLGSRRVARAQRGVHPRPTGKRGWSEAPTSPRHQNVLPLSSVVHDSIEVTLPEVKSWSDAYNDLVLHEKTLRARQAEREDRVLAAVEKTGNAIAQRGEREGVSAFYWLFEGGGSNTEVRRRTQASAPSWFAFHSLLVQPLLHQEGLSEPWFWGVSARRYANDELYLFPLSQMPADVSPAERLAFLGDEWRG